MHALATPQSMMTPWDPEADERLFCVAVFDETHDVRTFVFSAPSGRHFAYRPGQFLTFEFDIGRDVVSRCYSLASSPLRPLTASITVKRVPGGPVSNWLHDNLRPGMAVRARGPMGDFSCDHFPASRYLFVSGGSGVTPLMSMSRAFADRAGPVDIVFLHAARTPGDVIFRHELALISRRLTGFRVIFLPEARDGEPEWTGPIGRIDTALLKALVPDVGDRTVFCCGPATFMAAVHAACRDLGVAASNYHHETFDFAALQEEQSAARDPAVEDPAKRFAVTFTRLKRTIAVRADETVLKAARDAGIRLPSSCASGLCGTCKTRRISGEVEMSHKGGIRQREIDMGFFLPCCSRPSSDLVLER
jgi:glycine betaine catabolism B